ncbi:FG-GAP repeat-containing protein [Planoprotostelium fungivorum]|uniref:FG-GAP repeat-containing protein n=1 Tax=Planoprotostelium fungivorum TaxID=1890364 RepID=A0A2P6NCF4_9EUKA|nr:FG-GAP repeat-containing protein [Planoprotostelium fungivorum]
MIRTDERNLGLQLKPIEKLGKYELLILLLGLISVLAVSLAGSRLQISEGQSLASFVPKSSYSNAHYPQLHERLPPPIVTDIDGDGLNEVIHVDYDHKIRIHRYGIDKTFLKEASLASKLRIKSGRFPVAMATGYVTPSDPQQHIIVMTDSWSVLCYDHNLKLIWETSAKDSIPNDSYFEEAAAIILSNTIRITDRGLVIIGGRVAKKKADRLEQSVREVVGQGGHVIYDGESVELNHFSYFGFDAKTGHLRWKHEENDFKSTDNTDEASPEHGYKLHVVTNRHLGEVDWKKFGADVLAHTPHQWNGPMDTTFTSARFEQRRKMGKDRDMMEVVKGVEKRERRDNVIVVHNSDGMEVIHLYSGRMVCKLKLDRGLFTDINGDGIIDQIQALGQVEDDVDHNHPGASDSICSALATSGIPYQERLFNGSICNSVSKSPFLNLRSGPSAYTPASNIRAANLLVVPRYVVRETMWDLRFNSSRSSISLDSVFLISSGRVTCYHDNGDVSWQVDTDSRWDTENSADFRHDIAASLSTYSTMSTEPENLVLAVGHTGAIQATLKPLDYAVAPPVVADFNNDGVNDIIIVTPSGIYGHEVTRSVMVGLFGFLLAFFFLFGTVVVYIGTKGGLEVKSSTRKMKPRGD